jgi:ABC-type Fe3+-hydroxamate transport system substrate-binding protein
MNVKKYMKKRPEVQSLARRLAHEFIWLGPFVLLCLMAVTLFRPWATVPPVAKGRVILDGSDREVIIPEPFPGVVTGVYTGDFLMTTHAPETILKIGGPRSRPRSDDSGGLIYRIYPQLVRDDALWDFPTDTETVLAKDAGGVYLVGGSYFKEFGMTVVNFGPASYADWDSVIFTHTRVLNRVVDHTDRAETLIARYRRILTDMSKELRLETIAEADRPRAINMVDDGWERVSAESWYDDRLGLRAGAEGFESLGRESDVERILAMNPDMIILLVGNAGEFLRDSRWRGLDAVQGRRVYTKSTPLIGYSFDLDNRPLGLRWTAEIAYPDRLQPKMRDLMRDHYQESYGYRLSDGEIDEMLVVGNNRDSARYGRFASHAASPIPEQALPQR